MREQCSYCGEWFENNNYKPGETFKGIDYHHNPPEFFFSQDKKEWFNFPGAKLLNLCREHHQELHKQILIILNKKANTLKFNGSEHWLLQKLSPKQKQECAKEVFEYTNQWISHKN